MANTSKGVLFLPPSDAYVKSFLYLLYTLIKLYYTRLCAIKPHFWPRIEFFSSGGQESQCLFVCQQQPFIRILLSSGYWEDMFQVGPMGEGGQRRGLITHSFCVTKFY